MNQDMKDFIHFLEKKLIGHKASIERYDDEISELSSTIGKLEESRRNCVKGICEIEEALKITKEIKP